MHNPGTGKNCMTASAMPAEASFMRVLAGVPLMMSSRSAICIFSVEQTFMAR